MKNILSLTTLLLFATLNSSAQCTSQVTHTSGTATIGCTNVTVTQAGIVTTNTVYCNATQPYFIGYNAGSGNGSYTFTFSPPVSAVTLNFSGTSYNPGSHHEEIWLFVNGGHYAMSAVGSANGCDPLAVLTPNGDLMGCSGCGVSGWSGTQIAGPISTLTVLDTVFLGAPAGSLFSLFICAGSGAPTPFQLGNDTTYCGNFTRVLSTGDAGTVWSTGTTGSQLTVNSPGTYYATINNGCGIASDTITINQNPAPAAFNLGNDTLYCGNFTRVLNSGNAGSVWSTGITAAQISVNAPGTYYATSSNGCGTATDTIVITQSAAPAAFNLGADTLYCGSFTRVLNSSNAGAVWSTGVTATQITINNAGTYYATAANGCGMATDTIVITQGAAPAINLGNDTSVCYGQTVLLDATTPAAVYSWQNGAAASTFTVNSSGLYAVTVTTPGGCYTTDDILISVLLGDSLTASAINATCGHSNGSAAVQVINGTGPYSYLWSTGSTAASISALAKGSYTVTVTDAGNCTASITAYVDSIGAGSLSIQANRDTICVGDTALICAPSGFTSYIWNTGETSMCINAMLAGNYYVTASDGSACQIESNHVAVQTYVSPPVSVTVNSDTLTSFNGVSYQWYFNNAPINGATGQTHIAQQGGNYSVQITDAHGCTSRSNNILITGINNALQNNVEVYPNPSLNGNFTLLLQGSLPATLVQVFDNSGRLVYSHMFEAGTGTRQFAVEANVERGIYLMQVSSNGGSTIRKLIRM